MSREKETAAAEKHEECFMTYSKRLVVDELVI